MRNTVGLAFITLLVLTLSGCASRESKLIGTWGEGMTKLELKEDHTFIAAGVFSGTWKLEGDKITLTSSQGANAGANSVKGNVTADFSVEGTVSEDNKSLSVELPMVGKATLTKNESSS